MSISSLLVRHLGRAKKERGAGGGNGGTVHILSEARANRGSGHHWVRACHFLSARRGSYTGVQPSQHYSMGGIRGIALGHRVRELARRIGMSLPGFNAFAVSTTNCGIHLAAAKRPG